MSHGRFNTNVRTYSDNRETGMTGEAFPVKKEGEIITTSSTSLKRKRDEPANFSRS